MEFNAFVSELVSTCEGMCWKCCSFYAFIDATRGKHLVMIFFIGGAPIGFSGCDGCDHPELLFPPHFLEIVVEVKDSGPPRVLKLW